jgi:hypothetical protein
MAAYSVPVPRTRLALGGLAIVGDVDLQTPQRLMPAETFELDLPANSVPYAIPPEFDDEHLLVFIRQRRGH